MTKISLLVTLTSSKDSGESAHMQEIGSAVVECLTRD